MSLEQKRDVKTGRFINKHPKEQEKLYRVWCAMKERCNNPHNKSYKNYGAKGVSVCQEWADDYNSFAEWALLNGYIEGLTIDRINGEKGYYPDNCRWVTTAEQNRNYSRNVNITFNGITKCISDWAIETGINRATIAYRLRHGKTLADIFSPTDWRKKDVRKNECV